MHSVIVRRKECWVLSWQGRLLVVVIVAIIASLIALKIYPFLAITHRVDARALVVEGWIHKYAIHAAAEEFNSRSYRELFTTGGPVTGTGAYINDYDTAASVGVDLLKKAWLPQTS